MTLEHGLRRTITNRALIRGLYAAVQPPPIAKYRPRGGGLAGLLARAWSFILGVS